MKNCDKKAVYVLCQPNKSELSSSIGISNKIKCQINYYAMEGYDIKLFNPISNQDGGVLDRVRRRLPFFLEKRWLDFSDKDIDFIYIRKPPFVSYRFIAFLNNVRRKNPQTKILLEIPTYPYEYEIVRLVDKICLRKEKRVSKLYKRYIDKIITYSDDNTIWGIQTIKISNAVDITKNVNVEKIIINAVDELHIMLCAEYTFWHGYDRAIHGLVDYYRQGNNEKKIILHFVGDGPELEKYKDIIKKNQLEKYCLFYGRLSGKDLDRVYYKCDLALDSLGRHRSKVYYNSSLKGKEYCFRGLPIISGVTTEFDELDFKYYLRVPADESPVDFNIIINFYNKLIVDESKYVIFERMHQFAIERFSYQKTLEQVSTYLKMNV